MKYRRMPIEEESPEQFGYDRIRYNLTESSVRDRSLSDLGVSLGEVQGAHVGPEHWFEQHRRYVRIGYAWPQPSAALTL